MNLKKTTVKITDSKDAYAQLVSEMIHEGVSEDHAKKMVEAFKKRVAIPKKVEDASKNYLEELVHAGVSCTAIVKELDQYLSNKQAEEFVEHFKKLHDITDAVINSPVFTEAMIAAQKERIDKFKACLKCLPEEGINPADVVIAIDDYLNDYDRLRVVTEVQDKLGITGDFRSLHGMARVAKGYENILGVLDEVDIPDIVKEQAVTDLLMREEQITDSSDLEGRAAQVEKYTANPIALIDAGIVVYANDLLTVIDEICEEKVPSLLEQLSAKFDQPESLDTTIHEYVNHQHIDPLEAAKVVVEALPEEDRLVLVDSILE